MIYYSTDDRLSVKYGTWDLTKTTVIFPETAFLYKYIVTREQEMRLDKVCLDLYGNDEYVEELMIANNMMNMWSIKEGDEIYVFDTNDIVNYHGEEKFQYDKVLNNLVDISKETKADPTRNPVLPPTIKPKSLTPVEVDYQNKKIKINTDFK